MELKEESILARWPETQLQVNANVSQYLLHGNMLILSAISSQKLTRRCKIGVKSAL